MEELVKYNNGNTTVSISKDGTKIREYEGVPSPVFPESIDVKITDYCNLGCEYCHESSTTSGVHADLNILTETLKELPSGVELAIGGGNPLSHPHLVNFLYKLKEKGIIANITINQGHLKQFYHLIHFLIVEDLVKGVGISITSNNYTYIKKIQKLTENIVFHVIAGINKVSVMDDLIGTSDNCKVLVLGYKQFGFGINYYNEDVQKEIKHWYMQLPKYVGKCTLSFDNLAIEQLNVKRLFTVEGWDKFYMGDDFCFTMYIDAVKQQYSPTSRSKERKSFKDYSLVEYFQTFKNKAL